MGIGRNVKISGRPRMVPRKFGNGMWGNFDNIGKFGNYEINRMEIEFRVILAWGIGAKIRPLYF